jgi:DNA-binding SARP family transcriptional activator
MKALQIILFGEVQVAGHGLAPAVKLTPSIQALLAYLLLHRRHGHPREVLTELFWPEHGPERARHCLSTALWRLRRLLSPPDDCQETYLITTPAGNVGFNCDSDYWLDVEAFEQPAARLLTRSNPGIETAEAQAIEHALQFYTGELLEGFYDDWVLRERERLRALHLSYLARLMGYYRDQGDYERSLSYGQQILNHDPLREEIHREMMRLYLQNGQRALAVRQYELCAQALCEELDIPPMVETQRLYAELAQETDHHLLTAADEPAGWTQMLPQLRLTLHRVEAAQEQLRQIIRMGEQLARQRD